MKLGMQVGLGPGDIVLDGDPALPSKKGTAPKFSAHVYSGQTDVCRPIRIPLDIRMQSFFSRVSAQGGSRDMVEVRGAKGQVARPEGLRSGCGS